MTVDQLVPTIRVAPAGGPLVSDILTWRLARRVMVDHEFDVTSADGECRSCGGPWPCDAWRRAEDIATQYAP